MSALPPLASLAADVQRLAFDAARIMLYPVLVALLVCLGWVFVELGVFAYELVRRFRGRDLDALEISALRARKAFAAGKPRAAYRHLQENAYSIVVTRFLFELVRNYQTERLAAKPLKLLQDYEYYTVKRLERTRVLTRLGPVLGLAGGLIPLAPALSGLARGEIAPLTENLEISFSLAVIGLLIGGLAFLVGTVRGRLYAQDISDLEYLLEILEGNVLRLESGRRRDRTGKWEGDPSVSFVDVRETPAPEAGDDDADITGAWAIAPASAREDAASATLLADAAGESDPQSSTSFDEPARSWYTDDDPFAALGPAIEAGEQAETAERVTGVDASAPPSPDESS